MGDKKVYIYKHTSALFWVSVVGLSVVFVNKHHDTLAHGSVQLFFLNALEGTPLPAVRQRYLTADLDNRTMNVIPDSAVSICLTELLYN